MTTLFRKFLVGLVLVSLQWGLRATSALPPLLTTTATTTVDSGGRPWAYIALGENQRGLIGSRSLKIYSKIGLANSTNLFTPLGPVVGSSDPGVIQVQLGRGASIGENLVTLEAQLIALHRWLLNSYSSVNVSSNEPPTLPLNQRLAAILARAAGDEPLSQTLDLYGLAHPALRLVRGTAWAGPLAVPVGSPVTFEIREQNASGQDVSVIGRITILAGQPEILPIPGPLVVVPDLTSSGDLNIKLRWATPDPLRSAGGRHGGDIVWRVSRTYAEAQGFDQSPPTGSTLDQLSVSVPAEVARAGGPVFPAKLFEPGDVADFVGDPKTTYLADYHGRYSANGTPFIEGSQYYYFVAAADPLGRPGQASSPVLATVCRRVPPPVPSRVGVTHQWDPAGGQSLDVHWQVNSPSNPTTTTRYEVFRGTNLVQLAAAQRGELDLSAVPIVTGQQQAIQRVGVVADNGSPDGTVLHFMDDGGGVMGRTWWYAIRAFHPGPPGCSDLYSPLSPPIFGALQDRTAPPAPSNGDLMPPDVGCLRFGCVNDLPSMDELVSNDYDPAGFNFVVRCNRRPGVSAVSFQVIDTADGSVVVSQVSVVYPEGEDSVEFSWLAPFSTWGDIFDVQCAAEAIDGSISLWAHAPTQPMSLDAGHRTAVHFLAGAIEKSDLPTAAASGDVLWTALLNGPAPPCNSDVHLTVSPGNGRVVHPRFCIPLAPGSEQYHVYRRIDDGPLTLMAQGLQSYTGPGCAVTVEDGAPPQSNGSVCYFLQLLDAQGRGSAMRRLACLQFTGDTPPTPTLFAPQPSDFGGTVAGPTVNLTWVCPPEQVERFEIYVTSTKPPSAPDQGITVPPGSQFRLTTSLLGIPRLFKTTSLAGPLLRPPQIQRIERSFLTGRVGGDFAPGPRFLLPLQLDPTLKYSVWLCALGPNGERSAPSRSAEFQWKAPPPPIPDIAWPQRPPPPVAEFNAGIQAVDFSTFTAQRLVWPTIGIVSPPSVNPDETPVGIRVGSLSFSPTDPPQFGWNGQGNPMGPILGANDLQSVYGTLDPNQQVYTKSGDRQQSLLPFVLYRQQVANAAFPQVSGDVIQCSPYVNSIASARSGLARRFVEVQLIDPFFRWIAPDSSSPNPSVDLYLVDTQPVITGAAYRYWLVRFNLGEPIQTVPCGVVTIQ